MARRSAARCVATPCRRKRSGAASQTARALEEVEGARAGGSACTASGERSSTAATTDSTRRGSCPRPGWPGAARDDQRDVGLDGGDDVAGADALGLDEAQQAVARLGERRERLERLEGRGQATAVALVVAWRGAPAVARAASLAGGRGRGGAAGGSHGDGGSSSCIGPSAAWRLDGSPPPWVRRRFRGSPALSAGVDASDLSQACKRRVDAPQRLVAAEQRERSRRSRARPSCPRSRPAPAGRRRWASRRALDHLAQRRLDGLGVEGLDARPAPRARRASAPRPSASEPLLARRAGRRPGRRRRSPPAARSPPASGSSRGRSRPPAPQAAAAR